MGTALVLDHLDLLHHLVLVAKVAPLRQDHIQPIILLVQRHSLRPTCFPWPQCEVFVRRALLRRGELNLSGLQGQQLVPGCVRESCELRLLRLGE